MHNLIEVLLNIDLTILIVALAVLSGKLFSWLMRLFNFYRTYPRTYNFLAKQPYILTLLIIAAYVVVYQLNPYIPVINQSLGLANYPKLIIHLIEIICFLLSVFLIIREEKIIYLHLLEIIPKGRLNVIIRSVRQGFRALVLSLTLPFLLPDFVFFPGIKHSAQIITQMLIIWSVAWVLIQSAGALEKASLVYHEELDLTDYSARSIVTKTKILNKVISIIIIIVAIAATCLIFEKARTLGTSMLASAGIATGIIGFAATKTISNFLVGLQIAFTQPIKINDIVRVEDELGTIEDISLNYVIVKIWDFRRLILPISYFIEKPFINYSRDSTEIITQIIFFADYSLPTEEIREYFTNVVSNSAFWDKKTVKLQIIELGENTIKLRGLASAANSSDSWSLKYEILEKLSDYLTTNHPQSLPKHRLDNNFRGKSSNSV